MDIFLLFLRKKWLWYSHGTKTTDDYKQTESSQWYGDPVKHPFRSETK